MMFPKIEYGNNSSTSNSNNGQLLRDIEEISKALYLHKTVPRALKSTSHERSKSAGKTRISESYSNSIPSMRKEDHLPKDKKSLAVWNWKKPLKALSHIRQRRFNCCFFLHVHSIEGLPVNFDDFNMCVYWERKDEILRTQPARVSKGIAEFDETLMQKCCVHGSRNGPHSSAKYQEKLSLVYASVVGATGLDIGKHRVDLTRLLPLTFEELEGDKSSGKWTTSYNLTGRARGATINVSFGFSVMRDDVADSSNHMKLSELINLTKNRSRAVENGAGLLHSGNGMLRRVGSVPSNLNNESFHPTQSGDLKFCHEALLNSEVELSKSISFLYQKLDEVNLHNSADLNMLSEHNAELKPNTVLELPSSEKSSENEYDGTDFIVIERGIEMAKEEHFNLEQGTVQTVVDSEIETINVDDIIMDDDLVVDEESKYISKDDGQGRCTNGVVVDEWKYVENSICTKESSMEELESLFQNMLTLESAELDSPLATSEFVEQGNYVENHLNHKASRMMKKSLSLDDVTESVASEFLNMLGIVHTPSGVSSDAGDPDSPREQLLREFEKEALSSKNFILDFESKGEQVKFDFVAPTGSDCGDLSEDFDFSSVLPTVEKEHDRISQPLNIRRKAQLLEDLETEALMKEWGLNEKAFQNSPRVSSTGFGSPIELSPEEPLVLTPLGEGLGPVIRTRDGGFLRTMKPSIFKNAKHVGTLIMQISSSVVLPAELGADIMEMLQHMASVGVEKLSMQANKLMPLEDITGKTMQQVALEATPGVALPERQAFLQHKLEIGQRLFGERNELFSSSGRYNDLFSCLISGNTDSNYMTLGDLVLSATDEIESLSIEGLRIQSGMSGEEAPSSIIPKPVKKIAAFQGKIASLGEFLSLEGAAGWQRDKKDSDNDGDGLMGLSITLDEWLRLDAGLTDDEDRIIERTKKILAAHHANCTDFSGRLAGDVSSRKCGLLGNNLAVAFMVQLRDPLRNYEPVGVPMLAIIQVERTVVDQNFDVCSTASEANIEEESINEPECTSRFKFIELHLTGLNTEPDKKQLWGTTTQRQSGTRWLLASGMGKTHKYLSPKSMAMVKFSPLVKSKVQYGDFLWSISSCHPCTESSNREGLLSPMAHIRNPNVIFTNETIRSGHHM